MNPSSWLEDRRWRWRVIVLLIVLGVVAWLVQRGYEPLAAVGAAFIICVVATHIINMVIDRSDSPPPPDVTIDAASRFPKPDPSSGALGIGTPNAQGPLPDNSALDDEEAA